MIVIIMIVIIMMIIIIFNNLTRAHAKIRYHYNVDYYFIKCLSHNGLTINGKLWRKHHGYNKLESRDVIRMGNAEFTFWLPLAV